MILLTAYVAVISGPPVGLALRNAVLPEQVDFLVITTLIGGTIGGYITYAGAHRMLDSGVTGAANVAQIATSSVLGIIVTGVIRILLFLAILGWSPAAPSSRAKTRRPGLRDRSRTGGLRLFGVILWAASITSVIGSAYTSVSFITSPRTDPRRRSLYTCAFIRRLRVRVPLLGQAPTTLLILAGAVNGLILPVGFAVILWVAWRRRDLLDGYRYPAWLPPYWSGPPGC
jgi:Mn2+/Fe2+ NRAMP family transporter